MLLAVDLRPRSSGLTLQLRALEVQVGPSVAATSNETHLRCGLAHCSAVMR